MIISKIIKENIPSRKIPIWLMRQAGRSLPEYRHSVRHVHDFLEMCYNTDLIVELTLQPISRFNMDAAIIFSDILVLADVLGCDVNFIRGIGPKIKPINSPEDLHIIDQIEKKTLPILQAIYKVRTALPKEKSLIGFVGGPWTVASYIIEGCSSTSYPKTLNFNPLYLEQIIDIITDITISYLIKQIEFGVDVIQIFESNAGILSGDLFTKYIINPTKKITSVIKEKFQDFPIIGFPRSAGILYKDYCAFTGISAVSLDYNISLDWAIQNIKIPLQGNLHPSILASNKELALEEAKRIMISLRDRPFIFNLGHGVLPDTPVENIEALVKLVQGY
ncbi:uroporphyrinogen decarboxylase [Wolbachia endosymbiont of Howardula sp.]|uniref:uroporphyrinogen decarboxylase n=1 Tax=Wolbachia endosymbiont of Howardula sp. TaxID=2916816 RepID=UPI00217D91DD|nr:uroporphyrinogen decarboxylase [Wolbachia endosymbiont of Howardula sp.]UWI83206.1 uroporphyrinogen decarboxylase [Wolbachia endosymbiont of Howardula sp.]